MASPCVHGSKPPLRRWSVVGNGRSNDGARPFASLNIRHFYVSSRVGSCIVCLFVWPVARISAKDVALSVLVAFFWGGFKNLIRFDGKIKGPRPKRGTS